MSGGARSFAPRAIIFGLVLVLGLSDGGDACFGEAATVGLVAIIAFNASSMLLSDEFERFIKTFNPIDEPIRCSLRRDGDIGGGVVVVWSLGTEGYGSCLLYTSPSPRDGLLSRMPSSA